MIWIVALLGIIFSGVGFFLYRLGNKIKQEHTILTEGVVIGLEERRGDDGTTYALKVCFMDDQGREIVGNSMISKSLFLTKNYPVGAKVHVLYDALDSSSFIVKEYDINILGLVGLIFFGIGISLLFVFVGIELLVFISRLD